MDELAMRVVETSLVEKYQRQKSTFRHRDYKEKETCHHCQKKGHIMKNCWKLKNTKSNQARETKIFESNAGNVCFGVGNNSANSVLDSGAICTLIEEVTVGSGETIKSCGKGSCKIKLINRNVDEEIVHVK